ncbi:HK97-gp10 family putative phage morphogenesis protein [Ligilactobacillus sp.]|uniref:HK97-gp10 family putative phage morphogenesis protein n=1 Tax=Ligilactobacillus sp. TaxID=2767921 RepID=UPI002FDFBE6D
MARVTIEWTGDKELVKALEKAADKRRIREAIKKNTVQLHSRTINNERKAYINTSRQTTLQVKSTEGRVTVNTDYIMYLEKGTRFMAPEPAVEPAFDVQKQIFKNDLEKAVKEGFNGT